jgi:CubicO group peptidase (beta-lactamase class C family)
MASWERVLPQVASLLETGAAEGYHTGAQGCVTLEGETVADIAYGEGAPGATMTADTLMPWFSAGKPLAAIAIGQLWEKSLLELDDPVCLHIPEFAAGGKSAVTLRHLLTHTAGLRMNGHDFRQSNWTETVAAICREPMEVDWLPGVKAGYHRFSSWYILGEVVRRLDGRDYDRYVREMIFEPLGIRDSWLSIPAPDALRYEGRLGVMRDTTKQPPAIASKTTPEYLARCSPGSSARGPIRELARVYEMLRQHGRSGSHQLLTPQTVEALTTRHRVGLLDDTFRHRMDWGLGFILESNLYGAETVPYGYGHHASMRTFGHGGAQSSVAFCDPQRELVVALVLNGMPGEPRHQRRMRALLTALYVDLEL